MSSVPPPSQQLLAGDALRAVAAVSVVVYHYTYAAAVQSGSSGFSEAYGTWAGHVLGGLELGLYLFFVLSGYLIAGPWVRAYVAGSALPRAGRYARNRLLRLVPAFWVVLTVLLLVNGTFRAGPGDVVPIYLFAQDFVAPTTVQALIGPAWTLSVELAFYALVPAVAVVLLRLRGVRGTPSTRARAVVVGAAATWALSIAVKAQAPDSLRWQRLAPMLLFAFMPGVVLAAVEAGRNGRPCEARSARRRAAGLLGGGAVLLVLYAATARPGIPPLPGVAAPVLASLGCAGLVAAPMLLQWSGLEVPALLQRRPLLWLGERSYGIYLLHQGVLATILGWSGLSRQLAPRLLTTLAIGLPVTLVSAALLFALVERPFMRRRLPWRNPGRERAPSVSSRPTVPTG